MFELKKLKTEELMKLVEEFDIEGANNMGAADSTHKPHPLPRVPGEKGWGTCFHSPGVPVPCPPNPLKGEFYP